MSAGLRDVLALAASGVSPRVVAARTGLAVDLVDAMLDHAGRLGLAEPPGVRASGPAASAACSGCPATQPTGPPEEPRRLPPACAGCFFARR